MSTPADALTAAIGAAKQTQAAAVKASQDIEAERAAQTAKETAEAALTAPQRPS